MKRNPSPPIDLWKIVIEQRPGAGHPPCVRFVSFIHPRDAAKIMAGLANGGSDVR